tara:strand:+ start:483 stop:3410 length:2928 start_codon:yes stop_codon:yes gene_type:complete
MSSSYQGTEFAVEGQQQPFIVEKPVGTSVRSKSAIDIVAESLASINPAINAMLNLNIKKAVAEEKQKGFNLAVRENRREGGFKTVVDELRKNQEDGVTNRFIAGSIFAQDAFNETRASLLSARVPREIEALYNITTVESPLIAEDGTPLTDVNGDAITENRPLYEFPVTSPQYRDFAEQVNAIGEAESQFLQPEDKLKYLQAKELAFQKLEKNHVTRNNDFKFNTLTAQNNSVLLESYIKSKDADLSTPNIDLFENDELQKKAELDSLKLINDKITRDFQLGLTSDKSKKYYENLIKNIESVSYQIFERFGEDEARDFLRWAENIKYGNGKNTLLQHKDYKTKVFQIKSKIGKEVDRINENKDKREEEKAERFFDAGIQELLKKTNTGRILWLTPEGQELHQQMINQFPRYKEMIDDYVDLYNGDRKKAILQFRIDMNTGLYDDQPEKAKDRLNQLINDLGGYSRITDSESTMINTAIKDLNSIPDNQLNGGYKNLRKSMKDMIYNTLELNIDAEGSVSLFESFNNKGVNKFNMTAGQANIIAKNVLDKVLLDISDYRDSGDINEEDIQKYIEETIMGTGTKSIQKLLNDAIRPTDIEINLFSADGQEVLPIKINKYNDSDLYNKFQSGEVTEFNPPEDLFRKKNIPFKFYSNYYNTKNPKDFEGTDLPKIYLNNVNTIDGEVIDKGKIDSIEKLKKDAKGYSSLPLEENSNRFLASALSETRVASTDLSGLVNIPPDTIDTQPITHTVISGDNVSDIADKYNVLPQEIIDLNNLGDGSVININDKLKIPMNPVNTLFDFRNKEEMPFKDYGGFGKLIKTGESNNNYNAVNIKDGDNYVSGVVDGLDQKTIGEVLSDQSNGDYRAAGAYQFLYNTLNETYERAGLTKDSIFNKNNQDRLFWARMVNSSRPNIRAYLIGVSDDLDAALEDVSLEFAAAPDSTGKGQFDTDGRNQANIDLQLLKDSIKEARKQLIGK